MIEKLENEYKVILRNKVQIQQVKDAVEKALIALKNARDAIEKEKRTFVNIDSIGEISEHKGKDEILPIIWADPFFFSMLYPAAIKPDSNELGVFIKELTSKMKTYENELKKFNEHINNHQIVFNRNFKAFTEEYPWFEKIIEYLSKLKKIKTLYSISSDVSAPTKQVGGTPLNPSDPMAVLKSAGLGDRDIQNIKQGYLNNNDVQLSFKDNNDILKDIGTSKPGIYSVLEVPDQDSSPNYETIKVDEQPIKKIKLALDSLQKKYPTDLPKVPDPVPSDMSILIKKKDVDVEEAKKIASIAASSSELAKKQEASTATESRSDKLKDKEEMPPPPAPTAAQAPAPAVAISSPSAAKDDPKADIPKQTDDTVGGPKSSSAMPTAVANVMKVSSDRSRQKRLESLKQTVDMYAEFAKEMATKQSRWTKMINDATYESDVIEILKSGDQTKIAQQKRSAKKALQILEAATASIMTKSKRCFEDIKSFHLKEHRSELEAVYRFIADSYEQIEKTQDKTRQKSIDAELKSIEGPFLENIKNLREGTNTFLSFISTSLDKVDNVLSRKVSTLEYVDKSRCSALEKEIQLKQHKISVLKTKILSVYKLNYSMVDVVLDTQFIILYVIKAIRIVFIYVALFLATRIFIPMYESAVYDSKSLPPPLWKYLLIFIGFDLAFNAFLLVALFLLMYVFSTPDNNFPIDKYLFKKYLTDYALSMIFLMVIAYIISTVIMEKKYFKYKYEGSRAIRAFESAVLKVGIVIIILPFFWVI